MEYRRIISVRDFEYVTVFITQAKFEAYITFICC